MGFDPPLPVFFFFWNSYRYAHICMYISVKPLSRMRSARSLMGFDPPLPFFFFFLCGTVTDRAYMHIHISTAALTNEVLEECDGVRSAFASWSFFSLSNQVCIYTYIYICTHIHIYVHTFLYIDLSDAIFMYVHIHMYIYIHM